MTELKEKVLSMRAHKYICDRRDLSVHDKSCKKIEDIPDYAFAGLTGLPLADKRFHLAPCCARRIYLRKGLAEYSPEGQMDAIVKFFDTLGATDEHLKSLFIDLGATLLYQTPTKCIIHVNDDSWQIEIMKDGRLQLLHNNYIVNKISYSRKFNRGYDSFHEQNVGHRKRPTFDQLYRKMTEYSWADHIEYLKSKEEEERE